MTRPPGPVGGTIARMSFPQHRPRRLRRTPALRALVREVELSPRDLIAPLFVKEGIGEPIEISSMPGQYQHTLESLRKEVAETAARGVTAFMLFGVPERKDAQGSEAWSPEGIGQRGLRAGRGEGGERVGRRGRMDGRVAAIREALDGNGFERVGIIAYAAKFASAFYGPFREAAECASRFGDRTGYQMDPPNRDEAT